MNIEKGSIFFFARYIANDHFSEPPRRAEPNNPMFICCWNFSPGHLRGPGVSLSRVLGRVGRGGSGNASKAAQRLSGLLARPDFRRLREYVLAGHAPGARAKFSHALVWPFQLGLRTPTLRCGHLSGPSHARGRFFDFEVGGHDRAYKGRVYGIVPFVGRKNGKLFDCQQSYNVLVLGVPGLEEGVMFGGKA